MANHGSRASEPPEAEDTASSTSCTSGPVASSSHSESTRAGALSGRSSTTVPERTTPSQLPGV